jgi:hypothetical protein
VGDASKSTNEPSTLRRHPSKNHSSNDNTQKVIPMASTISTHNKTIENCPRETIHSANNKENSTLTPSKTSSHTTQLEQQHRNTAHQQITLTKSAEPTDTKASRMSKQKGQPQVQQFTFYWML